MRWKLYSRFVVGKKRPKGRRSCAACFLTAECRAGAQADTCVRLAPWPKLVSMSYLYIDSHRVSAEFRAGEREL